MITKILLAVVSFFLLLPSALPFEGRINATLTRGSDTQSFFYTAGTNQLRIERGETDRPYAKNIVNLETGDLTLVFPHNRSLVRLKPSAENQSATPPGFPAMPAMPPGVGPQPGSTALGAARPAAPVHIGPTNLPGMPQIPGMPQLPRMPQMPAGAGSGIPGGMPAMPMMPPMGMEKAELKSTGEKTNLLGLACEKFELKQRGEVMEIWATDKLLPFQPYQQNQPHRFGPRMIEEQWGELLKAKKLFPLLAVLRFERAPALGDDKSSALGPERLRFEVKSVSPEKIRDGTLFQPPADYHELEPLPF